MIQRLHCMITARRWEFVIRWRAIRGREGAIFDGAPLDVLTRWAHQDRARFDGYPEIQDAIGYAQGELAARRGACNSKHRDALGPVRLLVGQGAMNSQP